MPRRFPIDYPFGHKYIELNGLACGILLAGIGIGLGLIINWVLG
jgi:hypothetical protein